jgi:UDP-glucuronate 4-epimerase
VSGPRILVTGAAGFIGWHVVATLLESHHAVVGIDNFDPYYDRGVKDQRLAELRGLGLLEFHEVDIRDSRGVDAVLEGVDAVIHLAARPGVRQSVREPVIYREVNEAGTATLLDACRRRGIRRLVFASSSSVYGRGVAPPFREDAPLGDATSPYAVSKLAGERMLGRFARTTGARVAVLRLFSVYGPRLRPDLALYVFTSRLLQGQPVPLLGDGSSLRDFTHGSDVAKGVMAALEWTRCGPTACETINLGAGHPVRLDYIVSAVASCLGVEPVCEHRPMHPAELAVTWADGTKAAEVLEFAPRVPIARGIADYVAWHVREYGR